MSTRVRPQTKTVPNDGTVFGGHGRGFTSLHRKNTSLSIGERRSPMAAPPLAGPVTLPPQQWGNSLFPQTPSGSTPAIQQKYPSCEGYFWRPRPGLNRRIAVLQTAALTTSPRGPGSVFGMYQKEDTLAIIESGAEPRFFFKTLQWSYAEGRNSSHPRSLPSRCPHASSSARSSGLRRRRLRLHTDPETGRASRSAKN